MSEHETTPFERLVEDLDNGKAGSPADLAAVLRDLDDRSKPKAAEPTDVEPETPSPATVAKTAAKK